MTKPDGAPDGAIGAIEGSMMRVRRGMSRRTLGQLLTATITPPISLNVLGVIDTVEQGRSDGMDLVSVGDVAERMAVDPSRASRLVAEAVDQGFVSRVAWQSDGRRSGLQLTAQGTDIADQAHRIRRRYYLQLMATWTQAEQAQFAALLARFTSGMSGDDAVIEAADIAAQERPSSSGPNDAGAHNVGAGDVGAGDRAGHPAERPGSTVTVYPDGPLVLRGDFAVRHADGRTVPTGRVVALCRCGRSAVKPFCDNSHQFGLRRSEQDRTGAPGDPDQATIEAASE